MNAGFSVASFLLCAFALHGQIAATLNRLPNSIDEIIIRNNSANNLVAFGVTAKQVPMSSATSTAPLVVYSDTLIDSEMKPLGATEERIVLRRGIRYSEPARAESSRPSPRHTLEEPINVAGIFDNGTTTGDAALVSRMLSRRSSMLQALETALEMLLDAGKRNVPRDQLTEQFKRMAASIGRWYLPPEQQVGLGVYQPIIGKLINLPPLELGAPFPPAAFVAQETSALNRQRVALLESQPSLADGTLISTR